MRHSRYARALLLVVALTLVAAGCRRGARETTPEPETPSPTPGIESAGEFQLVAIVEHAFIGQTPEMLVPDEEEAFEQTPPPPVEGRETPAFGGILRVVLEAFSDELRDRCNADVGDRFNMFWTTNTQFDDELLTADVEETLDRRRIGVLGTIFRKPGEEDEEFAPGTESPSATTAATATPTGTPGLATLEGEDECILIAEQLGTSRGSLPTPRPGTTRRTTPTPAATLGPTEEPTEEPTEGPTTSPTQPPTEPPTGSVESE